MTTATATLMRAWRAVRVRVLERRFTKDVSVLTSANVAVAGIAIVQGITVARWLGPESYGIAILALAVPKAVSAFLTFRSSAALVKFLADRRFKEEPGRALALCKAGYLLDLTAATAMFLVVAASARWTANHVVHDPQSSWLIVLFAAALIPFSTISTSSAVLIHAGRFPMLAAVDVVVAVFRLVVVVGLLAAGHGVAGVVIGHASASLVHVALLSIISYMTAARQWSGHWPTAPFRPLRGVRREIGRFMLYDSGDSLLGVVRKHLDVTVLGLFRDAEEAGYYRLAKSFAALPAYVAGPLGTVTYAKLTKMWGDGKWPEMWRFVKSGIMRAGFPLALVTLAVIPALPLIISLTVGREFDDVVPIASVLFIGAALPLLLFPFAPLILTWGQVKARFNIKAVGSVLLALAMLVFVPLYGAMGLAWVMVGSFGFGAITSLAWSLGWGRQRARAALDRTLELQHST